MVGKDGTKKTADGEPKTHRFGAVTHEFSTSKKPSPWPRRAIEVSGVSGATLVPVGLVAVEGTLGIVVAVVGGLMALAAYVLSASKRHRGLTTKVVLHELGIVCSQGRQSRELMWNEVVDITYKTVSIPGAKATIALVFETVHPPPFLLMVGGPYGDERATALLIEKLGKIWLDVWCRRAKVLAELDGIQVGKAWVRHGCVVFGQRQLACSSITGVRTLDGVDRLQTDDGVESVETRGSAIPFPSTARRIVALASLPAEPLMLPLRRR